jgi:hypothetical protein
VRAFARALEERLREPDVTQVATVVMAALVLALITLWPATPRATNESWYGFAQTRGVVLALLALGFGTAASAERPRRSAVTAAVVGVIALLCVPLELAAYAATYPATPLWWPLASIAVATWAYVGVGVALGALARRLHVSVFLPLLVPGVVVGLLLLDLRLGWTVFNPLTASLEVSPWYGAATAALALLTLVWASHRWRRGDAGGLAP